MIEILSVSLIGPRNKILQREEFLRLGYGVRQKGFCMNWQEKWTWDNKTSMPKKVKVLLVSDTYCLAEGEDQTSYKGRFFDSAAEVFIAEYADNERSLRYAKEQKDKLDRAKERFERECK